MKFCDRFSFFVYRNIYIKEPRVMVREHAALLCTMTSRRQAIVFSFVMFDDECLFIVLYLFSINMDFIFSIM